jgi:hypothetical protein
MTEQSKRDFFQLVVEKETTSCWSWIGEYDLDKRPVFRGDKAFRVMHRLRVGDVPDRFHVHHKCENSACVNPRHLVALSPESHRAIHATKDKMLKERIYRGEWERIQAEKVEAERLEIEQLEQERLDQQRAELQRRERKRVAVIGNIWKTLFAGCAAGLVLMVKSYWDSTPVARTSQLLEQGTSPVPPLTVAPQKVPPKVPRQLGQNGGSIKIRQ